MTYVLITGECEVIGCETKIEVFATKEEAHDAMVRDAKARAWDAGVPEDEFDEFIDSIGDNGGYILDIVGWQIRELPGLFIPESDAPHTKRCVEAWAEAETRYDACEAALEACGILKKYV